VYNALQLDELPEALLGAVHLRNLDPDVAEPLYDRPTNQLLFSAATAAATATPRFSPGTCSGLSAILGKHCLYELYMLHYELCSAHFVHARSAVNLTKTLLQVYIRSTLFLQVTAFFAAIMLVWGIVHIHRF
jgi:hypothetical protein